MRFKTITSSLIVCIAITTVLTAQNLIGPNWKFQPGDDLAWAPVFRNGTP